MQEYREISPPAHLAETIECFWTMSLTGQPSVRHRVVPDGCADILFTSGPGKPSLVAVGPMTRFEDFEIPAGQWLVGIRFRPGMSASQLRLPGSRITDERLPLEDLWGQPARRLLERVAEAGSPEKCAAELAGCVRAPHSRTPVQRALAWMETLRGCVRLDDVARQANLSPRQFRRQCLDQTGLSPKLLARILRFRHALLKLNAQAGEHAGLAADCGYFDQSHFIAEFRRFAGESPTRYLHTR
ncbi:MAG: helix-turn-helix transcriptional regulator [Acidobacteriia bacterium]|nr:helix-turn-helix transcriptional regulator [Terriglobia bacterium]